MADADRWLVDGVEGQRNLSRREFVRRLSAAVAGGGLVTAAFAGCTLTRSQRAEAAEAMVAAAGKLPKRRFGTRMGNMRVTPVAICQDWPPELYAPALALGINYVHKAGYWSELPEEFKKLPRESYITDITVDSTPNNPDDEEGAYRQVTESLKRNGLGYYDIFKAHFGWKSVADMREKRGTYRAFQRLKKEGKVKYFGVSQHNWVPYPEIIAAQIDEGLIDTMQVFYSYATDPATEEVFAKAHKAGIGMMAMKIWSGGNGKMRNDPQMQAQMKAPGMPGRALIRHALWVKGPDGKPIFDIVVTNTRNMDQFEENVAGVGERISQVDGFMLGT